jgi:CRP/FNR family transcriptional regulator, cyclic AMP receptor protein
VGRPQRQHAGRSLGSWGPSNGLTARKDTLHAAARLLAAQPDIEERRSMSEPTTSFRAKGLFAGLTTEDVDGIVRVGEPVTFEPDRAIFESGDDGDAMYVITDGEAHVEVGGRSHVLGPGDVFGEMALLAPGKRMATVRAVSTVAALRVPADAFQAFLLQHPGVGLSIMKQLVLRLREVEQRIEAWMA